MVCSENETFLGLKMQKYKKIHRIYSLGFSEILTWWQPLKELKVTFLKKISGQLRLLPNNPFFTVDVSYFFCHFFAFYDSSREEEHFFFM